MTGSLAISDAEIETILTPLALFSEDEESRDGASTAKKKNRPVPRHALGGG
jgi:hypothetical protein